MLEKPQLLDQISSVELNQVYQCLNNQGVSVYTALENTDCYSRQCCGSHRPFTINILDPTGHSNISHSAPAIVGSVTDSLCPCLFAVAGKTVMRLNRPVRMNSAWCCCLLPINCCFLQEMTVTDINNNVLGRVVQRWSLCNPYFDLQDEAGNVLASIKGPYCTWPCFGDVQFELLDVGGAPIGSVIKKWGGVVREEFLANADNFAGRPAPSHTHTPTPRCACAVLTSSLPAVVFPMDLPIKTKVNSHRPLAFLHLLHCRCLESVRLTSTRPSLF